jgi:cell division protein ZapB
MLAQADSESRTRKTCNQSLTVSNPRPHNFAMSDPTPKSALEQEFRRLDTRVAELVSTLAQIKQENYSLRQRNEALVAERAGLLQKNEQVRTRVEGMIGRLKSLEHGA